MRYSVILLLLVTACHHKPTVPTPQNSPTGEVASVALGPYQYFSPFTCSMTSTVLRCVAAVDVSFLRGQTQYFIPRGYTFEFNTPKGTKGSGQIWYGCAGLNECAGFFMFGSNTVTVVPVEPARCWCSDKASETLVPHGSIPLFSVDIQDNQFIGIRPTFSGQNSYPLLLAGPGINVSCTPLACTVSLK